MAAGRAREEALQTEHDHGLLPHELTALAQQIAERAGCFGIDVAGGKHPEAEEMRQPSGIVPIVGVFQAAVLRERGRMGEVYRVPGIHEPIDEPVPIIRRLDGDALQRGLG